MPQKVVDSSLYVFLKPIVRKELESRKGFPSGSGKPFRHTPPHHSYHHYFRTEKISCALDRRVLGTAEGRIVILFSTYWIIVLRTIFIKTVKTLLTIIHYQYAGTCIADK